MKDPANITLNYVQKKADTFLKTYHPSFKLPIPIEEIAELQLNIRIVLIKKLIRDFGVNAFINQKFDAIIIDEVMYNKQPERIRFTIAEEVGHLFLHKEWYSRYGPKGIENYLEWQENFNPKLFDYIERQAKTFAGMVLMPEKILDKKWREFANKERISTPCPLIDLPDTFPELAQEFEVSPQSLLVRLSFLKLVNVPDGFWSKTCKKR